MSPQKKPKKTLLQYHQTITSFDIVVLTRLLSTMIAAGMPLIHALECIAQGHKKARMKKLLLALKNSIAEGCSFADSLKQHPSYFDSLFCQLIRAAEQSGTLEIMLKRIAEYLEKSATLKKKIQKALTYPAAILIVTLFVAVFLMVFIVPEFETLFSSFGTTLPAFTRLLINLSTFTQNHGGFFMTLTFISIFSIKIAKKQVKHFNDVIDENLLKVVFFGPLIKKAIFARISRTLATLLDSGTPLIEALTAIANTANYALYQNAFEHIRPRVICGTAIHVAMIETHLFPSLLTQMIRVGEETGSLVTMLNKVADYYEEEVDQTISNLSQLIEPFIMLILGSVVGCFVVAMYMPLFKLGSVF